MISKLPLNSILKKKFQIMFQICVLNQKNSKKRINMTYLKLFFSAMIRNIKIYNIFYIIKNLKSMELNKCTHQKIIMKIFI
jgi:hypothetical protein